MISSVDPLPKKGRADLALLTRGEIPAVGCGFYVTWREDKLWHMRSEGEVDDGDEEGDEIGHLCRGFCFPIFRPKSEILLVSLKSRTPNPTFPVSASRVEEILQDFSFRTRIGLWNNGFSLLGFRKWAFSLTIELASSNSNRVEHFLLIWSGFSFFFFFLLLRIFIRDFYWGFWARTPVCSFRIWSFSMKYEGICNGISEDRSGNGEA